ncbi:hypothetical protein KC332_g6536 [Hortaea werneckii]|nr:hypothetical protein KC358_g11350 [Hortaea werneckii]KAI6850315.1 hypothetical protein KC350_g2171 [Hortaea werneckii]KAI6940140.1 hypothetical protein KC341_g3712 [Hortaea werneckii]KAI6947420.1 hypothetical protein KC348_g2545 [Hortaea werneckii]KAI6979408.1 hypothetical protein KC321_g2371 [Hortaea werneckii]
MADWKVTVPINLSLTTITAIQKGGGIEAALSELAISGLEGHTVVRDVARAVIDTVNGSAYRITSNSETTMPPATYSHSTSRTAKGYEAYDALSTPKDSIRSQRTLGQEDSVKKGGWSSPLYIHIAIRSTINKDEHFYVTPDTTIASLFDSYVARKTVSGSFSGLELEVRGKENVYLEESATIKQLSLENDDILIALESPVVPVTVTFKEAMLRTHIVESEEETMVKNLLLSFADDTGHDCESLIFVVNGERELTETDHTSTLRNCGIVNGDFITVRPWEPEPRWINILVEDRLGRQKELAIREDARTSTLRSQYDALTGYRPGYLNFSFKGISLMNEQQLHTLGTQAGTTPLAVAQGGGMNLGGTESKILTSIGGLTEMFFIRHTHVGTDDGSLDQTAVFHKPNMSLKTTVEIVVDGHPTKCTVEVPLAALSLNGDPSHVTALDVADFAATTTAEVTKAVRRQASDFGVENPAINALDANVEECDSLGTGTGYDDAIRKEGHLNFSQGSSAAPSPEHDVNKDWFRNARTKKFVEAQTALGLGTASSTLQPLQDGTCEYRSSSDLVQPTSNRSYNRQGDCTACDEGYCWDHPPRCVDSQELLKNTNCGRSSIPLYDNVAQPSPSDWGRDDRISQSGGDWENGLGFTPPSEIQAESNVQPASDIEEGTDAQNIKVYVTNGLFKERCYKIKSTRALTGLFEDVSADFGTLLCGIMHLREGIVIKPNGTAEENSLIDGDHLFAS